LGSTAFIVFTVLSVITLKELNIRVTEPYMVRSRFCTYHRMILMFFRMSPFMSHRSRHTAMGTGPTGIRKSRHLPDCEIVGRDLLAYANRLRPSYVLTILLKKIFVFKCRLPTLRLTPLLSLLLLPLATTRLLRYHQRMRPPPSLLTPTLDSVVLSTFPIAWFFGFLYYTDVPSLLSVIITTVAASQGRHWVACMVRDVCAL
jgi:alpha-1,2-glucosyltransferase